VYLQSLGVVIDPTIESLTTRRTLASVTVARSIKSTTVARTIEEK
jgi:hypothetical protein